MLKFRPSNLTQKRPNIRYNETQLIALIEKGLNDNSLRGFLYKRSSPSAKWRLKWFLLFENLLFYFDVSPGQALASEQSGGGAQTGQHQATSGPGSGTNSAGNQEQQCYSAAANPQQPAGKGSSVLAMLIKRQVKQAPGARRPDQADPGTCRLLELDKLEPRRASASETLENARSWLAGGQPATPTAARSRQRLCSDPQSAALSAFVAGECLSEEMGGSLHRRTLNSSSISGVSGHFLAHNDQSIGRSTTTSAGKTASSNYASLLSRKIGVIFLEGSYCERLLDSAADFGGQEGNEVSLGAICALGPRSRQLSAL